MSPETSAMLAFIGDVHNRLTDFADWVDALPDEVTHVIQVGDLMVYPEAGRHPSACWRPPRRMVHFIDGNHHYFPDTRECTEPAIIRPQLTYVPRGQVLTLGGCRIGFQGGADSVVDLVPRQESGTWWADEAITDADVARWLAGPPNVVDLLVAHTPPASLLRRHGRTATSPSAERLERIWRHLGRPQLVAGHMHEWILRGKIEVLPEFGTSFRVVRDGRLVRCDPRAA